MPTPSVDSKNTKTHWIWKRGDVSTKSVHAYIHKFIFLEDRRSSRQTETHLLQNNWKIHILCHCWVMIYHSICHSNIGQYKVHFRIRCTNSLIFLQFLNVSPLIRIVSKSHLWHMSKLLSRNKFQILILITLKFWPLHSSIELNTGHTGNLLCRVYTRP